MASGKCVALGCCWRELGNATDWIYGGCRDGRERQLLMARLRGRAFGSLFGLHDLALGDVIRNSLGDGTSVDCAATNIPVNHREQ